jgi:DUF4097 and DUF4098 domain-containing protein YvlB
MATSRAIPAAALSAALFLGPAAARAGHHHGHTDGPNVTTNGQDPASCSDLTIDFDDVPAERAEVSRTIPVPAGKSLRVEAAQNSGVWVRGSDRADFRVTLCKGAEMKADLDAIRFSPQGDTLSVEGPNSRNWVGYMLIDSPRSAGIEVSAGNGPVSIVGLSGHVVLRSENGPISIHRSSGDIDARAENGPIAVAADGGRLHLATQNGPIAVALSGSSWNGGGLDARAVNGPVSLAVPEGYRSGTLVETLGRSPFVCHGDGCAGVRRTWDDEHKRLELGDGPVVVRLSTENGPVSIRTGASTRDDSDED